MVSDLEGITWKR